MNKELYLNLARDIFIRSLWSLLNKFSAEDLTAEDRVLYDALAAHPTVRDLDSPICPIKVGMKVRVLGGCSTESPILGSERLVTGVDDSEGVPGEFLIRLEDVPYPFDERDLEIVEEIDKG